ncbi:hypothetical protein OIU78_022947 [Salix suchowensis]|nr:hypothetical protein OIU78_022947 [Salix suchowensis]
MYFNDSVSYSETLAELDKAIPLLKQIVASILEIYTKGVCQLDHGVSETDKPNVRQSLIASYNTLLAPKVKAACMETRSISTKENGFIGIHSSGEHRISSDRISISIWFSQFSILLRRSLKERKHESFNSLRVFQVAMAAVLAGLMWWHSDFRDIQDRLGLLFFISIFWGVFPSSNSVFVFPQERAIFVKERASGMYTLSSYFMSRIVGDLPMELILPTIFSFCDVLDGRIETGIRCFPFDSAGSSRLRRRFSGSRTCSRRSNNGCQTSFNHGDNHNASICADRRILRA